MIYVSITETIARVSFIIQTYTNLIFTTNFPVFIFYYTCLIHRQILNWIYFAMVQWKSQFSLTVKNPGHIGQRSPRRSAGQSGIFSIQNREIFRPKLHDRMGG